MMWEPLVFQATCQTAVADLNSLDRIPPPRMGRFCRCGLVGPLSEIFSPNRGRSFFRFLVTRDRNDAANSSSLHFRPCFPNPQDGEGRSGRQGECHRSAWGRGTTWLPTLSSPDPPADGSVRLKQALRSGSGTLHLTDANGWSPGLAGVAGSHSHHCFRLISIAGGTHRVGSRYMLGEGCACSGFTVLRR
jgi:hypothetical protein